MQGLLWAAAIVVVSVLIDVLRRWRARRAMAADPTAASTTVAVALRGEASPWPRRYQRGRVQRTRSGGIAFVPTWRGLPLALGGLTLRSQGVHDSNRVEIELRFTDRQDISVSLRVDDSEVELLRGLLSQATPGTSRRWPGSLVVGLALAAASVLAAVWAIGLSRTETATVVGRTDYGSCRVQWTEPDGSVAQDTVDCDSSVPDGAELDIHATVWPLAGHAMTDVFRYPFFLGLVVLVCAPTAYLVMRRRRVLTMLDGFDVGGPVRLDPAVVDEVVLHPLSASDLDWDTVSDRLRHRADAEDWAAIGDPRDTPSIPRAGEEFRWWTVRPVARLLWHPVAGLAVAVLLLIGTVAFAAPWMQRARALSGPTVPAHAVVTDTPPERLIPVLPFQPTEVEVRFDDLDGSRTAWIAWAGAAPPPGTHVEIEIAVDNHTQARSVTDDGLTSAVVVGGLLVVALALAIGMGVRRRVRLLTSISGALRAGAIPVRYGMSFDPTGTAFVVVDQVDSTGSVVSGLVMEAAGKPVGCVPAAATGLAHGPAVEVGSWIVIEIGDRALWPAGPLMPIEAEDDVLDWLNAWHGVDEES